MKTVNTKRLSRKKLRVSRNITGTADRPRVVVSRSNRYIYAQAIDDVARKTVAAFSSQNLTAEQKKIKKSEQSKLVGTRLAEKLKEKKVQTAVFDRSYYIYLGRVKALCDGLRDGGIKI